MGFIAGITHAIVSVFPALKRKKRKMSHMRMQVVCQDVKPHKTYGSGYSINTYCAYLVRTHHLRGASK